MTKKHRSSEQGVALIVVLSLVAVMAMLAVTFFTAVNMENQASQSQSSAILAQQLAASASQMVMAQVQAASTRTTPGSADSNAVAWTSQPGLLRTFRVAAPASSASTVYKLYSSTNMVTDSYTENEDAPPSAWKSSPAIYCDINAPVSRTDGSLTYPVADPSVAGVVPGFTVGTAPGYSGSAPSPSNNPLPMAVRWLYVLKNGQLATPASVSANGTVIFTSSDPQPSASNPVIGRVAFWADDESCKVNINTAGYARNDANYWTYWDTPLQPTTNEMWRLSVAQPWNNEFLRYPGHPGTVGLNIVFEGLTNLTVDQTTALTPRYTNGGSLGGFNTVMSSGVTTMPIKNQRLYATVDEMFYSANRTQNTANGLTNDSVVEQRRFFLTANSRAPETTLLDTPRVTTWPIWSSTNSRTPLENLIAFCSTIGSKPFYFVRSDAASTNELSLTSNDELYEYLQTITGRNLPGVGDNFQTKYASQSASRDQILTSFFDAIRLANLFDASSSNKYTAASPGWVNTTYGPGGTVGAGRNPTLDEVAVVFARSITSMNTNATVNLPTLQSNAIGFVYYNLNIPSAGPVSPAFNVRMEVDGLTNFAVRSLNNEGTNTGMTNFQQMFLTNSWTNAIRNTTLTGTNGAVNQEFGGRKGSITMVNQIGLAPVSSLPLTNISTNSATNFIFRGGDLNIRLYSPTNSTTPYQTATIRFPDATNVPVPIETTTTQYAWTNGSGAGRFGSYGYFEGRAIKVDPTGSATGRDTVLAVTPRYGDFRTQAQKAVLTTNDFAPHPDYGVLREATSYGTQATNRLGSLVTNAPAYDQFARPDVPKGVVVERDFSGSPFFGGDWDSGIGYLRDGSYSPKTDEGVVTGTGVGYNQQYFYAGEMSNSVMGFFSPNRQIPSPGIFGNIPTGVWRTLLFRPARSYQMGGTNHFGARSPHDMYLLDFFHMPVVEPYAISEPFSTAGKINMNAHVVPFSGYITRDTALRALLASVRLTAMSTNVVTNISAATFITNANSITNKTRYPLNIAQTLLNFQDRYTNSSAPRVFLSEAEICDLDLVPDDVATRAGLPAFWTTNRVTGDNARERPYALLLPRLTTRSNSYTVHVTAQALAPGPGVVGWQEGRGKVLSEWRGAYTIERYVDPNDARFTTSGAPNFLSGTQPVGPYYRFRVLGTRRFNP